MPKAVQQKDLSVLSSARNGLAYLSPNDWTLIADKAVRREFKVGEMIVQKGKPTLGLFILLRGTATVQIGTVKVPAIGPGEVCGEISFLDELPATANVVAQEAVEAYYVDRPTLQSLFELFPHLGSRFYKSMACSLSRRMRDVIVPAEKK
ncbi:MAG TPA: cyclic nucleotide-binding domain-containing protein [Candidatus Solibacter sp.]|nr:cyclic nucleotide-binding domain-containing protein [Candidatus Solibacter sp.]